MKLISLTIAFIILSFSCNTKNANNSMIKADAAPSNPLSTMFEDILRFVDEYCNEGITCKIESQFYKLPNLEGDANDYSSDLARKISKIKAFDSSKKLIAETHIISPNNPTAVITESKISTIIDLFLDYIEKNNWAKSGGLDVSNEIVIDPERVRTFVGKFSISSDIVQGLRPEIVTHLDVVNIAGTLYRAVLSESGFGADSLSSSPVASPGSSPSSVIPDKQYTLSFFEEASFEGLNSWGRPVFGNKDTIPHISFSSANVRNRHFHITYEETLNGKPSISRYYFDLNPSSPAVINHGLITDTNLNMKLLEKAKRDQINRLVKVVRDNFKFVPCATN